MPPQGYYPYGPPPRRRNRWPLIVGGLVALVLIAGLAVGGWAYGTGRLGFGPLSAKDKAAAKAIAAGVKGPTWADSDQRACAATELLHHRRSGALADSGLVTSSGSSWTFTDKWHTSDAETYADALLKCSDDWKKQLAGQWGLSDTSCLGDVGRGKVADVLVTTALGLDSEDAQKAHDSAAKALDDCYRTGVANPTGTAKPAYRAVDFSFTLPTAANARTTLTVKGPDGVDHVKGSTYHAKVDEGGTNICIRATLRAKYGWGSVTTGSTKVCGRAKPKRMWWTKLPGCHEYANCVDWVLRLAGFRPGFIDYKVTDDDGGCPFTSGNCSSTALIGDDGRGLHDGYILKVTTGPGRRTDIIAKVDGMTARIPH